MSDEREAHLQALLKKIRKDLFVTVMFCSVGWFVMMHAAAMDGFGRVVLTLLGPIIAIFPILRSGGRGLFFWQHYEVIEIDRNTGQQVSTDGGRESNTMGLAGLLISLIAGVFATAAKLIFLMVKYTKTYFAVEKKPAFIKSAFPIMIFGFLAFFGGFGYWSTRQSAQLLKAHEQYSTVGTSQSDEFKAAGIEE